MLWECRLDNRKLKKKNVKIIFENFLKLNWFSKNFLYSKIMISIPNNRLTPKAIGLIIKKVKLKPIRKDDIFFYSSLANFFISIKENIVKAILEK